MSSPVILPRQMRARLSGITGEAGFDTTRDTTCATTAGITTDTTRGTTAATTAGLTADTIGTTTGTGRGTTGGITGDIAGVAIIIIVAKHRRSRRTREKHLTIINNTEYRDM